MIKNNFLIIVIIFLCVYILLHLLKEISLKSQGGRLTKIPKILYKTGPFKLEEIPNEIKECFIKNSEMLDIENKYFDDNQCRRFIKDNLSSNNLKAYDILIPTAFKAHFMPAVPEDTAIQYFALKYFEDSNSNSLT